MGFPRLYPYLSGRRNLELLARLDGDRDPGQVDEVLEAVSLTPYAAQKVRGYPSGCGNAWGLRPRCSAVPSC